MAKKVMKQRNEAFQVLLQSRGMTAYQLSKRLGHKDPYHAYKWVYGKAEPNAATMLRLMDILDVSAGEILRVFGDQQRRNEDECK